MEIKTQSRNKSVLFWIGLVSAVYEAVLNSLTASLSAANLGFPPVVGAVLGAIGVALATVLIYCNGNNPSMTSY